MGRLLGVMVIVLVARAAAWSPPAQAQSAEGRRVALVVGNSGYTHVEALANPASDARLMANTLRAAGFQLIGDGARIDLTKQQFDRAIQEFGRALRGAEVALFYYAGHGMQVREVNWLVPTDARPVSVSDLDFQMIDANLILRQMEQGGARLNLLILDACRNNPFALRGTRGGRPGLAEMRAPEGTLISYATEPGNVASDGGAGNSPYTTALAEAIHQPGLDVFQVFNRVGLAVKQVTGGQQVPWLASSPLAGSFYFFGGVAPRPPPGVSATADNDSVFWQSAERGGSRDDYQAYLRKFPDGTFAELAQRRIMALNAPDPPPAQYPPSRPIPAPMSPPVPAPAPVEPKRPESKGTSVTDMGRWTILRPMANCATTYYTWHSVGDTFTFRDQAGQTDTEQVLERRPGGATTRTLASRRRGAGGQPAGTRWDYHFQPDGSVRVRNLSSGKNFVLIKCP